MKDTFAHNLAKDASISPSTSKDLNTLFDGKIQSYVTTAGNDTSLTLEFN
jgi:alpha-L-fucosidase